MNDWTAEHIKNSIRGVQRILFIGSTIVIGVLWCIAEQLIKIVKLMELAGAAKK